MPTETLPAPVHPAAVLDLDWLIEQSRLPDDLAARVRRRLDPAQQHDERLTRSLT